MLQSMGLKRDTTEQLNNIKQDLELDMEQWTGSKLGKEYIKAVYCHSVYLTYMQSSVQFSHSVVSNSL